MAIDRRRLERLTQRLPTAPLAAAGLLGGFGIAVGSGSRPLGGLFMAACGVPCVVAWVQRDGRRTAARLTAAGLFAFAASHGLGLLIGAWPSVVLVSAVTAALYWRISDSRRGAIAQRTAAGAVGVGS